MPNGDTFEGEYKNGKRNGFGIYTFKSGHTIEGMWENGRNVG